MKTDGTVVAVYPSIRFGNEYEKKSTGSSVGIGLYVDFAAEFCDFAANAAAGHAFSAGWDVLRQAGEYALPHRRCVCEHARFARNAEP